MNPSPVLGPWQVAGAGLLLGAAALVSVVLRLGLARSLLVAGLRTVLQLTAMGLATSFIFRSNSLGLVVLVAAVMVTVAGRTAVRRVGRSYAGVIGHSTLALGLPGVVTGLVVTVGVVQSEPWYSPRELLPLLGMCLGNSLNGVSLALDHFLEGLAERRQEVEMELCHGATGWEASRDLVARAVHRGMIPSINGMTVVGLVSLPGVMTGQILAGADPLQAVMYQIVVMFMIAACTSTGCFVVTLLAQRACFGGGHRFTTPLSAEGRAR